MERFIKPWRLAVTILLVLSLTAVYLVTLYRLQIVEGAAYYAQSQSSIVTETTVVAARGNILDRYGRVLVSNRVCNNLIFNTDELFRQAEPNAVILELTQAVEDSGNVYTDTLPITKEAPFEYVANMSELQKTRLSAYLEAGGLPPSTTAVELMAFFRGAFDIDDSYTSEQTRTVAGVRYEIRIRYVIGTSDYIFAEDVSIDLITRLMENNVPGFLVQQSYVREYNTGYAAHLLGYIGLMDEAEYKTYRNEGYPLNAMVGKAGAEKAFESYLHGTDGKAIVTMTRGGTIISTRYTQEPSPGNHLYLTIDNGLQEAAEIALNQHIEETNRQREIDNANYAALGQEDKIQKPITGGAVAAVNVKTGEPLALASAPSFDLSTLLENWTALNTDEAAPLLNRALGGAYAPGSTFKPVTALAALDQQIVSTGTTIYDAGVFDKYANEGYAPTCWLYPHGSHGDVNAQNAIKVSCNYYFYTVGEQLGIDKLSDYALRFGLGTATGIELSERTGVMATQEYKRDEFDTDWYIGDTLQAAIGQSFSVFTPLQMANYTAAVAANGTRYEASILKAVRSYDYSKSVLERRAELADAVSLPQEYYDAVHAGLYDVANAVDGTAYQIFGGYPYKVAAKTGTAQLGEGVTNNGVFICYAPYDDPEIAVAVVVEKGGAGGAIAGIAKSVLDYYFSFKNSAVTLEHENALLK
jgi:penicillin-binding protein 2